MVTSSTFRKAGGKNWLRVGYELVTSWLQFDVYECFYYFLMVSFFYIFVYNINIILDINIIEEIMAYGLVTGVRR